MTSNNFMVGNDDLTGIVYRVKSNFGMKKRKYSQFYIDNSPLAQARSHRPQAFSVPIFASLLIFFGLCAWGVIMLIGGQEAQQTDQPTAANGQPLPTEKTSASLLVKPSSRPLK